MLLLLAAVLAAADGAASGFLSAWGTGFNPEAQLGLGTSTNADAFRWMKEGVLQVAVATPDVDMAGMSAVDGKSGHTLMLAKDGTVWAAGSNSEGQLGIGTSDGLTTFQQVHHCLYHIVHALTKIQFSTKNTCRIACTKPN